MPICPKIILTQKNKAVLQRKSYLDMFSLEPIETVWFGEVSQICPLSSLASVGIEIDHGIGPKFAQRVTTAGPEGP